MCTVPKFKFLRHPAQHFVNGELLQKYWADERVKILIIYVWVSELEETFNSFDSDFSICFYSWENTISGIADQNSLPFPRRTRSLHFFLHISEYLSHPVKVSMSLWPFIDFSGILSFPQTTVTSGSVVFPLILCLILIPAMCLTKKNKRREKMMVIERQVERRKRCRG